VLRLSPSGLICKGCACGHCGCSMPSGATWSHAGLRARCAATNQAQGDRATSTGKRRSVRRAPPSGAVCARLSLMLLFRGDRQMQRCMPAAHVHAGLRRSGSHRNYPVGAAESGTVHTWRAMRFRNITPPSGPRWLLPSNNLSARVSRMEVRMAWTAMVGLVIRTMKETACAVDVATTLNVRAKRYAARNRRSGPPAVVAFLHRERPPRRHVSRFWCGEGVTRTHQRR
jgi:hypothetical protein